MIIVADTSPILNLERIGRLSLLPALYGEIVVPEAVFAELSVPGESDFASMTWLKVHRANNRQLVNKLTSQVDAGEAEAIALATELSAYLLIIDERRARSLAISEGLHITGLAGVLVDAKNAGLLTDVKSVLDELKSVARFRISNDLYLDVLGMAGEL